MNICLRNIVLAVLLSVSGVSRVSGFTQADSGDEYADRRSSLQVVRVYVAADGAAFDRALDAPNLTVSPVYRPLLERMLERSATFRRQYARLTEATHLSVAIRSEPPSGTRLPAVTRIRRQPDGGLQAVVQLDPCPRSVELLAHEIEHIIEQLDGVDLPLKSRLRGSGVRQVRDGGLDAFETTRAVVTGERVAREVNTRTP